MPVYRYKVEIGEDRLLTLPAAVPVGRAEIVVTTESHSDFDWEKFQQAVRQISTGRHHAKTKEEIDAYIRHERESWE